ncbi:MAG: hypothetical protein V1747_03015 [Candidatus Omnitrophota bacterium]
MRNFKKRLLFILFGLIFFCPAALSQIDIQQELDTGATAVNKIFNMYSSYSQAGFDSVVSNDFMPLRSEFMSKVDASAVNEQALEFNVSVDQVLILEKKMAVMCQWYKKFTVSKTPGQQKTQGKSELIFQLEGDQWKLVKLNGDNPF